MVFFRRTKDQEPWAYRVFGATLGSAVMFFVEVLQVIVIAAAIIVPIRYFLIQPFVVKGASMEPNFFDSEYLIIDEMTYRFRDVQRGDIIVFRPPNNSSQFYIKRVIGLPGETVEIKDGTITIYNSEFPNGVELQEDYVEDYTAGRERITLGLNELYLLGDNRDASLDSRTFGPVTPEHIVGRVWLRGLPLDRIGTIPHPDYHF